MEENSLIEEKIQTEQPTNKEESKEFALIMKGGGAKGLAYVGALQVLEEYGYKFTWFVGTSAGAIMAVLLAAGYTANELEKILKDTDFKKFRDVSFLKLFPNIISGRGLYSGDKLKAWIESLLKAKLKINQDDIPIKLNQLHKGNNNRLTIYAVAKHENAKDFDSHKEKTKDFDASWVVRASASIPYFFTRTTIQDKYVFDGGLSHNYPIDVFLTKYNQNKELNFLGLYLGSNSIIHKENRNVLSDLLDSWLTGNDRTGLMKYGEKTIVIDPSPITTLQFDLHEKEKEFLLAVGRASALEFLANQEATKTLVTDDKLSEAKTIADNLRDEIIQISKNRKRKRRRKQGIATFVTMIVFLIFISGLAFFTYFIVSKYFPLSNPKEQSFESNKNADLNLSSYKPKPEAVELITTADFFLELQKTTIDNARNVKIALILSNDALMEDSNYYKAYITKANAWLSHEDSIGTKAQESLFEAHNNIEKAEELAKQQGINDPQIDITFGLTYFNQWKWSDAKNKFETVTNNSPSVKAFINYARLTRTLGDYEKTQELLDKALELNKESPGVHTHLGMFHLAKGDDPQLAIDEFNKALDNKGVYANLCWLSVALLQQNKIDEAIAKAEEADKKLEYIHDTQAFLAYAYAHKKETQTKAIKIINKLEKDYRNSMATATDVAIAYAGFKNRDKTIEWLEKAVEDKSGVLATYIAMPQFKFLENDEKFIKIKYGDLKIPQKEK